ncbi:MAG: hypothetical protein Q8R83_03065 [Legionellaceae bacterium]|nr:hypothetical protein [Legionellaceae bacterium]
MMKKSIVVFFITVLIITIDLSYAETRSTARISQFSNNRTNVWKTIIYPNSNQVLAMHRHDYDRVLVALSNGLLKVTNNKGKMHYLKLEKDKAYYLTKDPEHELHRDENITNYPIKVMIIELKK